MDEVRLREWLPKLSAADLSLLLAISVKEGAKRAEIDELTFLERLYGSLLLDQLIGRRTR